MSQDVDIGRVAAALKAPGLRYRTFGNEPVRPASLPAAKGAVTIAAVEAVPAPAADVPRAPEGPLPTMRLIADGLSSPAAVPGFLPTAAAPPPAWPLLDALRHPAAEPEPRGAGTLVRLFGGAAPVEPAAPGMPATPAIAAAPPFALAPPPAMPVPSGPMPALAGAASPPAAAPGLVPAGQVTSSLADVFQSLGRGVAAPVSPFAALRLPGTGPGAR